MDRQNTSTRRRKKEAVATVGSFRVLVIGAPDTGKKSLIERYTHGTFDESKAKVCDDSYSLGIITPTGWSEADMPKRRPTSCAIVDEVSRMNTPAAPKGFLSLLDSAALHPDVLKAKEAVETAHMDLKTQSTPNMSSNRRASASSVTDAEVEMAEKKMAMPLPQANRLLSGHRPGAAPAPERRKAPARNAPWGKAPKIPSPKPRLSQSDDDHAASSSGSTKPKASVPKAKPQASSGPTGSIPKVSVPKGRASLRSTLPRSDFQKAEPPKGIIPKALGPLGRMPLVPSESPNVPMARLMSDSDDKREAPKAVGLFSLLGEPDREVLNRGKQAARPRATPVFGEAAPLAPQPPRAATMGFMSMMDEKDKTKMNAKSQPTTMGFLSLVDSGLREVCDEEAAMKEAKKDSKSSAFEKLMTSADLLKYEQCKKRQQELMDEKHIARAQLMVNDRNVQTEFKFMHSLSNDNSREDVERAQGFLIVFSVASRESFSAAQRLLFKLSQLKRQSQHSVLLVGTMNDDLSRIVSDIEAKNLGKKYEVDYMECSAKNNVGVDTIFQDLLVQIDFEVTSFPNWLVARSETKDKLSVAVMHRNVTKIKQLLATKNPQTRSKAGWAPIHAACWEGYYEIVYMFLQVQPECVNTLSTDEWTPLHVASRMGFLSIVNLLLTSGADVLARDSHKCLATTSRYQTIRSLIKTKVSSRLRNMSIKAKSHIEKVVTEGWQLLELDLSYIKVRRFTTSIYELTHLVTVSFLDTALAELSPAITKLKNLKTLILNKNELTFIPEEIGELRSLEVLDIRSNKLTSLPASIGNMTSLQSLLLHSNLLTYLPSQLGNLEHSLEMLDVYGNPLNTIPQDVIPKVGVTSPSEMGTLFAYLRGIGEDGDGEYYRVKVMFVGDGNVGKTSLLNCFMERDKKKSKPEKKRLASSTAISVSSSATNSLMDKEPTDTIATDGIDINDVSVTLPTGQEMTWDCWDYAGQEIYYTTHQFFLSRRSIYLIIFNLLDRNFSKTEYWLNSIHARARGSPIVLVGTHVDAKECTHEYLTKYMEDFMGTVKPERFKSKLGAKSVKGVYTVSSKKRVGVKELMDGLSDIVVKQKMVGQLFPTTWLKLESTLAALRQDGETPFLKWGEFERVAAGCNVNEESVKDAAQFLHTIGVLCYFDDKKSGLDQLVVLDPQFLTNVMSAVITLKHRYGQDQRSEGMITSLDLQHIWREFPKDMVPVLMGLLQSFEILHKLPRDPTASFDTFIIPSLLPTQQPDIRPYWTLVQGQKANGLVFGRVYDFEFLPLGFFSRLIVRNLHLPAIQELCYWRYGMVLTYGTNTTALLRYNPSIYKLTLEVYNPQADSDGAEYSDAVRMLRVLLENIDTTIEGWYETKIDVRVPCSHCILEGSYDKWEFPLELCMQRVTDATGFVLCRDVRRIRLDVLAPDISFADLKRLIIPAEAITTDFVIGEGAFGTVYKGTYRGQAVAIKKLNSIMGADSEDPLTVTATTRQEEVEDMKDKFSEFQREVWIMSCMNHVNVCGLLGICNNPMALVMDFLAEGDLYHSIASPAMFDKEILTEKDQKKLDKRNRLKEWPLQMNIALDIARGMRHLHSFSPQIIHRDLRSPNIFMKTLDLDAPARALVGDFGLSRMVAPTLAGGEFNANWLAPEVMRNEAYTSKMDVYGFGIILWELVTCKRPFEEYDDDFAGKPTAMFYTAVIDGLRPTVPTGLNEKTVDLMKRCWAHDPEDRPVFEDVVAELKVIMDETSVPYYSSDCEEDGEEEDDLRTSDVHEITSSANVKEVATLHKRLEPGHPHTINVMVEAISDKLVWAGTANGEIWVWDVKSLAFVKNFAVPNSVRIYSMVVVGDHVWVGLDDGSIAVYHRELHKKIYHLSDHSCSVRALCSVTVETVKKGKATTDAFVWSGDVDGNIVVWKIRPKKKPKMRTRLKLAGLVSCMHRHANVVCVGTEGPVLQVDVKTLQVVGQWQGHSSLVNGLLSFKDQVWSCSNDGTIRIWELGEDPVHEPLSVHTAKVLCMIAVSGYVWTGSFDMTIGIWDPELVQELSDAHKDGVRALLASGGSGHTEVWSGGMERDPHILVWRVDTFACG